MMINRPLASVILALSIAGTFLALKGGLASAPAATAVPPADAPGTPAGAVRSITVEDLDGNRHALADGHAAAVVFLGSDCPISIKSLPTLNDLATHARLPVLVVLSDPALSREAATTFRKDSALAAPVVLDADGALAAMLKPRCTPEAFVVGGTGAVVYRGRIDDRFTTLAREHAHTSTHELADAIDAVAAGKPVPVAQTDPVGCAFEAWRPTPTTRPTVTFARDVAPILYGNCISCHRPGESAPFPLVSYADAARHAEQIAAVTGSHLMPPWKAEPGFGHFLGERRLTDAQIATLSAWADAGAPEGNPADLPPAPRFADGWQLGKPDLILTLPAAYDVPASGRDVYRCFVIPSGLTADRDVAGIEFRAGAPSVVHHCLIFLDTNGAAMAKQQANADGEPGYATFGGPGFRPTGGLGGWAPGAMPLLLPDGTGRPMRAGTDVVLQVHYHPDGRPHRDQSQIGIHFAARPVTRRVISFPVGNRRIDIAPGDAHYVKDYSFTTPIDTTLIGVIPHMHLLGREMKATATTPDGTTVPLIWVKDWDFRWQDQYRCAQEIQLPRGTRIDVHAVYDNSAGNPSNPSSPPKRVHFGEQTTDEMCICFLEVTIDRNSPAAVLLRALLERRNAASSTQPADAK